MKNLITLFFALFLSTASFAEPKIIKFVIPYSAGGTTDVLTKILIKHLDNENYKFVPEYKLGAGGVIAFNHIASSKNENTISIVPNGIVVAPNLKNPNVNYNIKEDFTTVSILGFSPLIVLVNSKENINNFNDFLNAGKIKPMPYGSGGIATSTHMSAAIISNNNKNYYHIPYKGNGPMMVDLLNGSIKWTVDDIGNSLQFIQSNRLTPVAIYYKNRLEELPNIPTINELGLDDRNFYRWFIVIGNKNIDKNIVSYVQTKLKSKELREEIKKFGLKDEKVNLDNFLTDEFIKVENILKDFNILN